MAAAAAGNIQKLTRYVLLYLLIVLLFVTGDAVVVGAAGASSSPPSTRTTEQATGGRRLLIGSRAPTCTYNECRGCRHRCSVREVPVDASDPINSAYRYKCVCHV